MAVYPAQYESDVVLRDGSTLRLRPVRPEDRDGLLALYDRLSPESRRFRFLATVAANEAEVERLLRADHDSDFVLVAEAGGRISGVALYLRDPRSPDRAEAAFAIADALQGRGVGTRMLEVLAGIARGEFPASATRAARNAPLGPDVPWHGVGSHGRRGEAD